MKNVVTFNPHKKMYLAVAVAALGYFVDVYDIQLFSIVRISSLKSLGVSGDSLLTTGVYLLNMQLIGMLIGGFLWGVLGDKYGRIQIFFGSILFYSLANITNAYVSSVGQYALCRLAAGIGLAGEIGAGITLVSEILPKEKRGYGTAIVTAIGAFGAVAGAFVGDFFDWRTAYIVGGILGLLLLLLRVSLCESSIFHGVLQQRDIYKGSLKLLFLNKKKMLRYSICVLIGVPLWFLVGILITFCPEIGVA
jgi:MFS transporter, putative metabolite:H+ symporter